MHLKLIGLGQYSHGRCRSMYASLRLGHRHTLYSVYTALVLQRTVHILSCHIEDDLLVAAYGTLAERRHTVLKALDLKILGVHPEQVSCKNSCFVTTGTTADLHHHILAVLRILG